MLDFLRRKPRALPALPPQPDPFPAQQAPKARAVMATTSTPYVRHNYWDGQKFHGGYGPTELLITDYWTLRQRSGELYRKNIYARGIIRRLVTAIVNTGLNLEATPRESVLGIPEDTLAAWSELVETRWALWADNSELCDHTELQSFGEIQAAALTEALVAGDVLVVLRRDQRTGLPRVQLINAGSVQTPKLQAFRRKGQNKIVHGVEIDSEGRHIAYHVAQEDGSSRRILARGPKTGRRLAALLYGCDKRVGDVRGEPLLSLALQSLKEIDRYRDAVLRKAELNAMLAMFLKREQGTLGSAPITGGYGALRDELETTVDTTGTERSIRISEQIPGLVIEELQPGEEPQGFGNQGTDEKFGGFEEAIIQSLAWGLEIPPEILRLSFSHNYSASQAANNEFALFLKRARDVFARQLCQPCYQEWQLSEVLSGKIEAAGLLEAYRSPRHYDVYAAWVATDWAGQIKPAADMLKVVRAYEFMVNNGFMTRSRAARELGGMKFSTLIKLLKKENEQLAAALAPLQQNTVPLRLSPEEGQAQDAADEQEEQSGNNADEQDAGNKAERAKLHVASR